MGRGGSVIKKLQEETDTVMQLESHSPSEGFGDDRLLRVECTLGDATRNRAAVENALVKVRELVQRVNH